MSRIEDIPADQLKKEASPTPPPAPDKIELKFIEGEQAGAPTAIGYRGAYDVMIYGKRLGSIITIYPTNNCQLFTISAACMIFTREDALDILRVIRRRVRKPLLLIDIRAELDESVMKIVPKSHVVLRAPYHSSNGSNMIIKIINISFLD